MTTLRTASPKRVRTLPACILVLATALSAGQASGATRRVPEEYPTIQSAMDVSAIGDTVLIAPGIYRGIGNRDLEFRGRDIVVRSKDGPELTIIDCQGAGRGFYLDGMETRAARIQGLTIRNGAPAPGSSDSWGGGGIFCGYAAPTIMECRILDCRAHYGAGLELVVFDGVIDGCVIAGNAAANYRGGGIEFMAGGAEVRNCVVTGNTSDRGAGICLSSTGSIEFTNCTIVGNSGSGDGAGIYAAFRPVVLEKCIVWENCSASGVDEIRCPGADIRCSDVDSTGVYSATGVIAYDDDCIFVDPMFCDDIGCGLGTGGDWSLDGGSPCHPEHSPCGELIGALGWGCGTPPPMGACCLSNGSCVELGAQQCTDQSGTYMGDGSTCESNPCQPTPTRRTTWGRLKMLYR